MGINEFFYTIAKVVHRFVEEIAEERAREKEQKIGRSPKVEPANSEKNSPKEAFFHSAQSEGRGKGSFI